jgi:transcriptional regulator NrdR family protein
MVCPNCGGNSKVIDVVYNPNDNERYRRRECLVCGSRFYTTEFIVDDDKQFKKCWSEYSVTTRKKYVRKNKKKEV